MPQVIVVLNRALVARGRRKGLLWDEPAPLGTAGWDCCGPACPPCTALPRRHSPKHLPTVMDEHQPDHQPHQRPHAVSAPLHPLQGTSLGEGAALKGKAGGPGAAQPSSVVCKGPFPEGITVCPKGSRPPASHAAHPALQQSLATVLSGNLHGAKRDTADPQISFHALHRTAAPGSRQGTCHLCISSAFTTHHYLHRQVPGRAHSARHTVSPGPAGATTAVPAAVPPQPGERKTDLCKGQLMRKLFASRSVGSTGEEQGSSRVAGLSDDNKPAQPEHATSSNARLLPLFWENKRGTRPFLARSCLA